MIKLENNWRQKSLESLEKKTWPALSSDEGSYLIKTCNSFRKKTTSRFYDRRLANNDWTRNWALFFNAVSN